MKALILIIIGLAVSCFSMGFMEHSDSRIADPRISKNERALIMLHTCFPNGHYKEDATPECPAFNQAIDQSLKGE